MLKRFRLQTSVESKARQMEMLFILIYRIGNSEVSWCEGFSIESTLHYTVYKYIHCTCTTTYTTQHGTTLHHTTLHYTCPTM